MIHSSFKFALLALSGALVPAAAMAQAYPSKPVRIIIPYPSASGPDLITRAMSPYISESIGQPVVIENKGGGGGVPAVMDLVNSAPDGYTLFAPDSSQWAIYPAARGDAPYDAVRDFAAISRVYTSNLAVYVNASSPIKDLKELIATAKANPGKLRYGATGVAGIMHLTGAALATGAGINVVAVPYRASAEAVAAVLRGDIDYAVSGWQSIVPNVKAGKLRALGLSTLLLGDDAMGVRSVADAAGLPGFNYGVEYGIVARAGTAKAIVDKLNSAINRAMSQPDVIKQGKAQSFDMNPISPEQFADIIRNDVKRYAQLAKAANIKAE